jgi:hypothetical protein
LANVFKQLELGVEDDLNTLRSLYPDDPAKLSLVRGRNRFSVTLVTDPIMSLITASVDFELSKDGITVQNAERILFKVVIGLNHAGQCKLKAEDDGPELEQWQVRRMALEKLFFGPRS